jgi:hypothetical protein
MTCVCSDLRTLGPCDLHELSESRRERRWDCAVFLVIIHSPVELFLEGNRCDCPSRRRQTRRETGRGWMVGSKLHHHLAFFPLQEPRETR